MRWEQDEEKDLINVVNSCKNLGLPIKNAFRSHSLKYMRSEQSTKRHYYKVVLPNFNVTGGGESAFNNVVSIDEYKNPKITEKDLEALFKGLVRLIREQIQSDNNGT